jgi:hypothetical protein
MILEKMFKKAVADYKKADKYDERYGISVEEYNERNMTARVLELTLKIGRLPKQPLIQRLILQWFIVFIWRQNELPGYQLRQVKRTYKTMRFWEHLFIAPMAALLSNTVIIQGKTLLLNSRSSNTTSEKSSCLYHNRSFFCCTIPLTYLILLIIFKII